MPAFGEKENQKHLLWLPECWNERGGKEGELQLMAKPLQPHYLTSVTPLPLYTDSIPYLPM